MAQSPERLVLHLPQLKRLKFTGACELFHLIEAAPNLDDLSIDFDCYNKLINDESTCKLLQKQIVHLELFRLKNLETIRLDVIVRKFTNLRYMFLNAKDSSILVDSLLLQALEMWRKEELIYLCIEGDLSRGASDIRRWFTDHTHLKLEKSFAIDNELNWIHLWM